MSPPALVYLHGFASSPASSKARFVADRARTAGVPFACPDLNRPDFASLTVTRMLDQLDAELGALPPGPVALVGSSLGAFVAVQAAGRPPVEGRPVDRLVLLAPAFDIAAGLEADFGPERMANWERTGSIDVLHYADGKTHPLRWEFMADARRYPPFGADVRLPTLVIHGRHDEVVDCAMAERYAAGRPWVTLRLVDDGHQLLGHLDQIWNEIARFIGAGT